MLGILRGGNRKLMQVKSHATNGDGRRINYALLRATEVCNRNFDGSDTSTDILKVETLRSRPFKEPSSHAGKY